MEVLTGTVDIACYGCGWSSAVARFGVAGRGQAVSTLGFYSPPGVTCLATSTASGTITGAVTGSIWWVQPAPGVLVGAIEKPDTTYRGGGSLVITSPVGNPCGGPATATTTFTFGGP